MNQVSLAPPASASNTMQPDERARKITSTVLQAVQRDATQANLATLLEMSESTLSRFLSDHLDKMSQILAYTGHKVVPTDYKCVEPRVLEFLLYCHETMVKYAPHLLLEHAE